MAKIEQPWVPLFLKFIEYLRINSKEAVSVDDKGAELKLWRSQKIFLNFIKSGLEEDAHWFMVGKSRQLGISTVSEALDIFWLAYHPNMMGCYVCDTDSNRKIIREKLRRFVESFPDGFFGSKFSITANNEKFMLFSNGSRLDFLIGGSKTKENWGEGRGYTMVHLTECSKFGTMAGINNFCESFSATHPNRLFIFESTSKGINHWTEMWDEFGRDTYDKRRLFVGWWGKEINTIKKKDPKFAIFGTLEPDEYEQELIDKVERDYGYKVTQEQLAWYRFQHSNTTKSDADLFQNQPWTIEQSFVASGHSFFDMKKLQDEAAYLTPYPYIGYKYLIGNDFWNVVCEEIDDPNRADEVTLKVWEEPDDDGVYVIGCDPAYGRAEDKDSHAIQVFRCFGDKLLQVAEWTDNKPETKQAAWVLAHLAGAYKNCLINVEAAPGPGGVIINELENLRDRVRIDPRFEAADVKNPAWDDFLFTARWYLFKKPDSFSPGFVKCWESNFKTKGQIMHLTHDKYTCDILEIRSAKLVAEMMDVIRNGDRIEAPSPKHDDRVISMALCVRAWNDDLMMYLIGQGEFYDKYLRKLEGEEESPMSKAIGFAIKNFFNQQEDYVAPPTPRQVWEEENGFTPRS